MSKTNRLIREIESSNASEDDKKFFGISLKKKSRVQEDDPTLINKAFNTLLIGDEFQELKDELDEARINFFTDLVIEAVNEGFIRYTDINDSTGKKLKTKAQWRTFSTSTAGRKELYLSKKKDKGINSDLEEAISTLLKATMADPTASLTDKTKILDRALKLEQLKLKMSDEEWGSGFLDDDDT